MCVPLRKIVLKLAVKLDLRIADLASDSVGFEFLHLRVVHQLELPLGGSDPGARTGNVS